MTMSSQLLSEARENGLLFASVRAPAKLVEENSHYKVYNVHGSIFEVDAHYELLMGIGFGAYGVVCAAADLRFVSTNNNSDNPYYNKFIVEGERNGNVLIRHREHRCYADWEAAQNNIDSKPNNTSDTDKKGKMNKKYNFYTITKFNTEHTENNYNNNCTEDRQMPAAKMWTRGEEHRKDTELLFAYNVPTLEYEPFTRRMLMMHNNNMTPSPFVAIKKIPKLFDDLIDARRVLREIKTLRFLRGHPNVVRLLDVSWRPSLMELYECNANMDDNHLCSTNNTDTSTTVANSVHVNVNNSCNMLNELYITTELLDTDLATLMRSEHTLDEEQIRYICYQIIVALVYIHSSGVIHRDMKPGNILVNGNCEVKLCDFGLARGGVPLPPHSTVTSAFHTSSETSFAKTNVTKECHLLEQASETANAKKEANSVMCDDKEVTPYEEEDDEALLFQQYQFRADDMESWSCDDRHGKQSTVQKHSKTSNATTTTESNTNTSANRYNNTDDAKQREGQRKYNDREEIEWETMNQGANNICKSQMYTLTDYVVTRYYRAPELLVMGKYNHAVDMWAVGCILGELILRRPLFMGANFLTQLALILQTPGLRGLPTSPQALEDMFDGGQEGKEFIKQVLFAHHRASCNIEEKEVDHNQGEHHQELQHTRNTRSTSKPSSSAITISSTTASTNTNTKTRPFELKTSLPSSSHSAAANNYSQGNIALLRSALFDSQHVSMHAMQLLSRLLSFNPRDRPTALEALHHPYFAKVFNPKGAIVRDLTNDLNTQIAESELSSHLSSQHQCYLSEIEENDVKYYRNFIIEEIAPPYLWAFDHRTASREGLQSLFCEEVHYYADVKRQWHNMKEQQTPSKA